MDPLSRYKNCLLNLRFQIDMTKDEIRRHELSDFLRTPVNSAAHGTRRTGLMRVVVSVELPGFARGSCLRRDMGVIGLAHKMTSICHARTEDARA
jgi:hypothetical protein